MKKMLITLLLAISTGSHATVLKKRYRHIPPCFPTTEKGKR